MVLEDAGGPQFLSKERSFWIQSRCYATSWIKPSSQKSVQNRQCKISEPNGQNCSKNDAIS